MKKIIFNYLSVGKWQRKKNDLKKKLETERRIFEWKKIKKQSKYYLNKDKKKKK